MKDLRAKRNKKALVDDSDDDEEEDAKDLDDDDAYEEGPGSKARGYETKEATDEPEVTIDKLIESGIVLKHKHLIGMVHESYFEDAVVGCYIKLGVGTHPTSGKDCYRLCKITGVTKGTSNYFANRKDTKVRGGGGEGRLSEATAAYNPPI